MLRNQIQNINYARISTGNTKQLSSLGTQIQQLKKYCDTYTITTISSGEDEFPDDLKNKISDAKNQNKDVKINVTSFNRLTRCFSNMDFLVKNVRYIFVLDENKQYDVKNERLTILEQINTSYSEVETLRNNALRQSRLQKLSGVRRTRSESQDDEHAKLFNSQKRKSVVSDNIKSDGVPEDFVKNLENFVELTQNLNSLQKWNKMFETAKNMGLNINKIKKNYEDYFNKYKNKNYKEVHKLEKSDVLDMIFNILKKNKYSCDNNFVNHFVNTNIRHCNL